MRAPDRLVVPSSQPMPTTATSASAVVGPSTSGALKKVAMPLNGSAVGHGLLLIAPPYVVAWSPGDHS